MSDEVEDKALVALTEIIREAMWRTDLSTPLRPYLEARGLRPYSPYVKPGDEKESAWQY